MTEPKDQAGEAQQTFFRVTDGIPEEAWYWAALGSIGISALLKLSGKDAGADSLTLDLTAKTYRYLDEEELASAAEAEKEKGPVRRRSSGT